MENLEFMLGVLSTVGVFLVGYAMDEIGKDHYNNMNDLRLDYQNQIDEIYRQMDSRFDKFENRINK